MKETIRSIDKKILCISFIYPDEALRVVTKELIFIPNFIFIDINMPMMTGDKVLREMRKNSLLDETIITMFSTSIPRAVSQALKEAGANYTFQKPNGMEDYSKVISSILTT